MVGKGIISSMYLRPDNQSAGLVIVSPELRWFRVTEVVIPLESSKSYHLGMEVLVDTETRQVIYQ